MRQAVTGLLVVLTLALGAPFAGASPSDATLLGQLVDAGGRGAVGQSVELVRDGAIVTTTVTTVNGEFMFVGIAPGSYIVRTMVNNHAAGTRIAVKAGESIPVTVVLPSLATASPQVGVIAGFIATLSSNAAATISSVIFTNIKQSSDLFYANNIPISLVQSFADHIQDIVGVNFDIARTIKIGPYGTS